MFNRYKFIFQRLIWKMISAYFLWFDHFQEMKNYENAKSLSPHTINTNDWST